MRMRFSRGLRLLLGGALLFATEGASCVADALRDVSNDVSGWADNIDGQNTNDLSTLLNDLDAMFD